MRFFQTCLSVGKRFTAAAFKEKPCDLTKTVGMGKTALIGRAGKFALGRPLKVLLEEFSSLQRTLAVASRWKRRWARARTNSAFFSIRQPKRFMGLISNTDAPSATLPAFGLWDTSALIKCSARIRMICCITVARMEQCSP